MVLSTTSSITCLYDLWPQPRPCLIHNHHQPVCPMSWTCGKQFPLVIYLCLSQPLCPICEKRNFSKLSNWYSIERALYNLVRKWELEMISAAVQPSLFRFMVTIAAQTGDLYVRTKTKTTFTASYRYYTYSTYFAMLAFTLPMSTSPAWPDLV